MEPNVSFYAVATALNPALRLNWFQNHWKNFPLRVRKAHQSMKKLFEDYISSKAEADNELQLPPPSRQKLPSSSSSNNLYAWAMAIDLHLLTGNKNKRQHCIGHLKEYYKALSIDLNTTNKRGWPELDKPWRWWLQVGRNRFPILFKMATNCLSIPSQRDKPSQMIKMGLAAE
ncbi:hypothetical protein EJ02DRAFT_486282 [Clathrospora elynae]|uniref:HAT C-terminal dimerisation domain-containing protein n=1 Tax=Clathrospora elynae TaxID=706981 RepID=A0A6A5ST58_9PLEO|nr:hypothetical protein EJ02DRAFT_486282 [Clathrospora elynae]